VTHPSGRRTAAVRWSLAFSGYGLLACLLTWPLPMHLRTHLLGHPGGDLGTYIWNLWVFRHELLDHGRIPISTDHLFAYTGGADFSVHNYTPIASAIGAIILAPVGVVGAFNTLLLVFVSLSGRSVFLLAKRLGLSTMAPDR